MRAALLALMLFLPVCGTASAEYDRFVHAYAAQFTHEAFVDTFALQADFDDRWLAAVGIGGRFAAPREHIQLEWELQAAKHWGLLHHEEVNALGIVRRHGYSWDDVIRTSAAFGLGLSYAFERPVYETLDSKGERMLVYMMFELTAAPPRTRDWSVFMRIHHRSGVFGLVADVDGSNFIGIGLRHHY